MFLFTTFAIYMTFILLNNTKSWKQQQPSTCCRANHAAMWCPLTALWCFVISFIQTGRKHRA